MVQTIWLYKTNHEVEEHGGALAGKWKPDGGTEDEGTGDNMKRERTRLKSSEEWKFYDTL